MTLPKTLSVSPKTEAGAALIDENGVSRAFIYAADSYAPASDHALALALAECWNARPKPEVRITATFEAGCDTCGASREYEREEGAHLWADAHVCP
jgi:hypothetical protein